MMNQIKKLASVFLSAMLISLFAACGVQEDDNSTPPSDPCVDCGDAGTTDPVDDPTDDPCSDCEDPVEPTCDPAPFWSPAPYTLAVSSHYVSDAPCGEIRGDLPGVYWLKSDRPDDVLPLKVEDTNGDGYMTVYVEGLADGCYRMSYLGWQSCEGYQPIDEEAWAQYGNADLCDGDEFIENTGSAKNLAFCIEGGEITGNGNL